jgi:hypothetical protein
VSGLWDRDKSIEKKLKIITQPIFFQKQIYYDVSMSNIIIIHYTQSQYICSSIST